MHVHVLPDVQCKLVYEHVHVLPDVQCTCTSTYTCTCTTNYNCGHIKFFNLCTCVTASLSCLIIHSTCIYMYM